MHKACVWCGAFVYCLQVPLFPEPGQWVWCVNIQTGSTPTKTIPDASEKDATSQNQTQACAKKTHRTHPCASSLTMPKATECFCWNDLSEVNTKRTKKNVDYSGFRCNCLEIDVLEGYYQWQMFAKAMAYRAPRNAFLWRLIINYKKR